MATSSQERSYAWRIWLVIGIAGGAILMAGLFVVLFKGVLVLFAGVLFGIFLNQLSFYLSRAVNVRYGAAFAAVVLAFVLLFIGTGSFMGARIAYQITALSEQFSQASAQLQTRFEELGWLQWLDGSAGSGRSPVIPQRLLSTAGSAAIMTLTTIGSVVLVMFLGFYFALQPSVYRDGMIALVPVRYRKRAGALLGQIHQTLWWWILGRLVGMLLIGVVSGVGLWLLGIPLPITLGVIAALMNFVPNLGPLIASVPPILFGLQQGTNVALYVAGLYLMLQFVESYFITPLIDQRQVQLPPGLILACQLLFGLLAGFLGLLLATPLTVVIYVLVRELYVKDVVEANA